MVPLTPQNLICKLPSFTFLTAIVTAWKCLLALNGLKPPPLAAKSFFSGPRCLRQGSSFHNPVGCFVQAGVARSITKIDLIRYIGSVNLPEYKKSPSAEQVGFAELDWSKFRS
jgi:hypothetical protein